MPDQAHYDLSGLLPIAVELGMSMIGALLVLIIGLWLAGRARVWTIRALGRAPTVDDMLKNFLGGIVKYLIIIATLLAVLGEFGVETTSLLAVLGAAGLAVGLALQGTLSNVAAGVMLLLFRPFKVGNFVEVAGKSGTVKDLGLFTTELATPDNVQIVIPNGDVWGAAVTNYSFHATRRVDFTFGISYADDIDKAIGVIRRVIEADGRAHDDPEPLIAVQGLGDSSVDLVVRVWCDAGDYWPLKFDLTKAVKEAFDREGVSIPFPTRTIHEAAD